MTAKLWGMVGGLVILLAILGGIYAWGRSNGVEAQSKKDSAQIAQKNRELLAASQALTAASRTFREIDSITKESREQGERVKVEATKATKEAQAQRDRLAEQINRINQEAREETCESAKLRVCGAPLR